MLHHVDIHVRDLRAARRLFDALGETIGYRQRADDEPDFLGYEPVGEPRPRFGFMRDAQTERGSMRLAFGVANREGVDRAARIAGEHGACALDGPGLHPEYGDDYYALFFEDVDGNRYEVVADASAARPPGFDPG